MYQASPHFGTAVSIASPAWNVPVPLCPPAYLLHKGIFLLGQFLPFFRSQIKYVFPQGYSLATCLGQVPLLHTFILLPLVNYLSYVYISY